MAEVAARAGGLDPDGVVPEVGQLEVLAHEPAVGHRVGAHPAVALRRQRGELRQQGALRVEQLVRAVAAHPRLELREVLRVRPHLVQRHLVRAEGALDLLPVDDLRAGPALGGAEHDHRPARRLPGRGRAGRRGVADLRDPVEHGVERLGELPVHHGGVVARDLERLPAPALDQRAQLLVRQARQHRRVRDLVAVEMQDRHDGAVPHRVEEGRRVPARRERPRLRLPVADGAERDEVRVVEHGAGRVHQRVAELAALVDRAGRLRSGVARDPARERELAEQPVQALPVLPDVRVELAVGALEVGVRHDRGTAVAGAGDEDRVEVPLLDHPVGVRVDEVQTRGRAPVPEQAGLDVRRGERHLEQRVVEQVDLTDGEVVRRPPVPVDQGQLVVGDRNGGGIGSRHAAHPSPVLLGVDRAVAGTAVRKWHDGDQFPGRSMFRRRRNAST